MGKKIFVSYKYADNDVKTITNYRLSYINTVRDYVDELEDLIGEEDIYKGESDDNDLSQLTDESIWSQLKQKIFDSSITIVLISPNMKNLAKDEKDQWIPQEIAYSLKEMTRYDNKKSRSNALVYVVLPNKTGSYDYFMRTYYSYYGSINYNYSVIFNIMKNNLYNHKKNHVSSYAVIAKWDDFVKDYNRYINMAIDNQNNIDEYDICKQI